MSRIDYNYGQITVRAYTGPLKYAVTKKDQGKLVSGYINASKRKKLIECMYNPYSKSIYISEAMYHQNKGGIDEALSENEFAVITRERARLYVNKDKWEAELLDMGIDNRNISIFIKVLKTGGISYGNLLDYHIRGVEFSFFQGNYIIVNRGEDKWKIVFNNGNYDLFHNSYTMLADGSRYIYRPIEYHFQGSYPLLKQVLYIITNYSYEWHQLMEKDNLVEADSFIKAYVKIKVAFKRLFIKEKDALEARKDALCDRGCPREL